MPHDRVPRLDSEESSEPFDRDDRSEPLLPILRRLPVGWQIKRLAGMAYPDRVATAVEREAVGDQVLRLGGPARAWRTAVVVGLTLGFCAGSLVGDDHWWPFSPWRMFSTSQAPTGAVWSTGIEVQTADAPGRWVPAPLTPSTVGLNRAEIEGRIPQIERDPGRLATLARSHAELRPDAPAWTALRVVRRQIVVVDRRLTGEERVEVLAQWRASS